jgi:predicted RNA-binding protein YlxR (DUF448 family)
MRKQPQRTCIGCRGVFSKRELVRLVRTPAGEILLDPTGKAAGRGAYLCRNRACWLAALKGNRIEQALHAPLSDADRAQIEAYAAQLGTEQS